MDRLEGQWQCFFLLWTNWPCRAFSITWHQPCKYTRKEFDSHRIGLGHQYRRRCHCLGQRVYKYWTLLNAPSVKFILKYIRDPSPLTSEDVDYITSCFFDVAGAKSQFVYITKKAGDCLRIKIIFSSVRNNFLLFTLRKFFYNIFLYFTRASGTCKPPRKYNMKTKFATQENKPSQVAKLTVQFHHHFHPRRPYQYKFLSCHLHNTQCTYSIRTCMKTS